MYTHTHNKHSKIIHTFQAEEWHVQYLVWILQQTAAVYMFGGKKEMYSILLTWPELNNTLVSAKVKEQIDNPFQINWQNILKPTDNTIDDTANDNSEGYLEIRWTAYSIPRGNPRLRRRRFPLCVPHRRFRLGNTSRKSQTQDGAKISSKVAWL